ncbi:hypothetical protein GOBAR_DD01803 [Gossypium barbadense]|nr:hypothetical protein GOBAR_DD01803 [Gossypium barbadense]
MRNLTTPFSPTPMTTDGPPSTEPRGSSRCQRSVIGEQWCQWACEWRLVRGVHEGAWQHAALGGLGARVCCC